MTAERDQVGVAVGHRGLRRIGFKPTRGDDRSVEDFAQLLRGNRTLPFGDQFATLDPRFDDVEIGQLEVVESLGDVAEQSARVAICHAVEGSARRDPDADATGTPDANERLDHLEKEPGAVFDRAAIAVGSLVAVVLKELIDQMAIGSHKLDAVETSLLRFESS